MPEPGVELAGSSVTALSRNPGGFGNENVDMRILLGDEDEISTGLQ
jgi:hypothetical protein